MSRSFQILIRFYQVFLGPIFGGSCRFEPSCSCYAHQAFAIHGLKGGLKLTVRRLSRCHPWGPYGLDPVPRKGSKDS